MKRVFRAGLLAALAAAAYKASLAPRGGTARFDGLAWPIDCRLGTDCRVINFPDPRRTGTTAHCRKNHIAGHEGTDIVVSQAAMDRGVPVRAAAAGTVLWAFDGKFDRCPDPAQPDCASPPGPMRPGRTVGTDVCTALGPYCRDGRGSCFWCFGGGNVVVIRHDAGVFATRYDHFRKGSVRVKPGQTIEEGEVIGLVGSAGRSSGPHLHFEVWGKTFYDPVDPWAGPCSPEGARTLFARQPDPG